MFPAVLEDVDERMADLPRRRESSSVVPVVPDGSAAAENAIDGLGDANRETLNAATQSHGTVCFYEQVDVIALHAEMEEPEPVCRRLRERGTYRRENDLVPQRRKIGARSQRDVNGAATIVGGSAPVGHAACAWVRAFVPRRHAARPTSAAFGVPIGEAVVAS